MAISYTRRSDVPEEFTWDLSDLFPSQEAWLAEYEALKSVPAQAAAMRGTLGSSADALLAWLRLQDDIQVRLEKLYTYASCFGDQDVTDSTGQTHQLTDGTLVPLLESPDAAFRKTVFETYYSRMGEFKNFAAAALDAQFKQLRFFSQARRYPGTRAAALDENEVPEAVYDNLIDAVHANLDKMYKYVALRKRLLGVEELHMWDVYTPIVADAAVQIPFQQAKETVSNAVSSLTGGGQTTASGKKQKSYAQQLMDSFAKSATTSAGRETGRTLTRNLLGIFGLSATGKRK